MQLTLTATATQARFLRDRWAAERLAAGVTAWETPPILSLQAWMRQQWGLLQQQGVVLPLLLSPEQERRVWHQCRPLRLQESEGFLRKGDLVDHAVRANRLFHQWCGIEESLDSLLQGTHLEEIELFAEWRQHFVAHCEASQWLEPARLSHYFLQLLSEQQLLPPEQIHCYGLEGWCRAERQLLEQLRAQGVMVSEVPLEPLRGSAVTWVAADPQAEIVAVAEAIRVQLQQNPQQHIGVVIPDLSARRSEIDRIFSQRLVPQSAVEVVVPQQLPYRFSSGLPLLDDPRIHHALQLLKLTQRKLPLLELSALLRSPWLLLGAEMEARSRIDLQLRSLGQLEVSLQALVRLLQADGSEAASAAPRFLGALQALQQLESQLESREERSTRYWAEHYTSALAFFEWAENGEQSVVALNAYNGWREVLDRFVALGEVIGSVSAQQAQQELKQLLSGMEMESGRAGRPLEVMTPQDADGVQFDALWVLSCDDVQWPQQQPLSPLLPQEWQRQRVKGCDPLNARQWAEALLTRLQGAAGQVCFSCSEREEPGGESVRSLTPLLGAMDSHLVNPLEREIWWLPQQPLVLEEIEEPSVALSEGGAVRGGSTLLANQSQCPFRAFVRHRLLATALEQPQPGLDARERGSLLHELLERCWRELGQRSGVLQQMDDGALRSLVYKVAGGVVEQFRHRLQARIGPRFAANEHERLSQLALRALQLDRQRQMPFRVEEMERQHQVELAGLTFSVKMDRVDQIADGGRILIDYKSGKVNRSDWQGERPAAPQLPLYAILLDQVSAVLYGQIRAEEVCYRGEQQEASVMEGVAGGGRSPAVAVSEAWREQLQAWRVVLEALAQEFRDGVATVDPLHGSSSCQYCGLEPLCRVEL